MCGTKVCRRWWRWLMAAMVWRDGGVGFSDSFFDGWGAVFILLSPPWLGLSLDIVVRFLPSCYPDSASSTHLHGFDGLRMHPYGHPLNHKVLNHIIHIWDRSFIQSAVVPGLSLDIVVRFVPSCYPDSASSTHLHGFDGLRMQPYGHPLHRKVLKYFIYIYNRCVIQSEVVPEIDYVILVGLYTVVTQVQPAWHTSMGLMK
jgi:hypothetical protein